MTPRERLAIVGLDGKLEWEIKVGAIHDAHILPNGHILTQPGCTQIVEVMPDKRTVREYDAAKMNGNEGKKGEVHAFQRLANGNTLIGNCHAGPENSQFIEITPKKKVVWTFKDFTNFGNSMPVQMVLGAK